MSRNRKRSKVDEQIDENLRRVYDDMLGEAVPDRFLDLIEQLRRTEPPRPSGGKERDDA